MNCRKCNNLIDDVKFCGKCGNKVEIDTGTDLDQEKLIEKVKNVGLFFKFFGYVDIFLSVLIITFLVGDFSILESASLYYSDAAFLIVHGLLWIILGARINKNIDKNSRKYLLVIFWLQTIAAANLFLSYIASSRHIGADFLLAFTFAYVAKRGLNKLKLINLKDEVVNYKLQGWKWVWFAVGAIILIGISYFF